VTLPQSSGARHRLGETISAGQSDNTVQVAAGISRAFQWGEVCAL